MKLRSILNLLIAALCSAACFAYAQEPINGLPNLSTRSHSDESVDFFADLIVWTAKEAGAGCWAEVIVSDPSSLSNDLLAVHFGWDPGYRVGIGYGMRHDQWDTQVYYTWFTTRGADSALGGSGRVHSTFLGNFYVNNPEGQGLSGPSYEKASIAWTIRYNMFDWELARKYRVSQALLLRPFVGMKGGWIDQSIHSRWENPNLTGPAFFPVGTENLKNNFWGIGPSAGIHTQWDLFANNSHCFLFFGDFSGAMMWGHWSFSDLFQSDMPTQVSVNLQNIKSGASMLRTFMGFGWDVHFHQNRRRFSTKLGFEAQIWFDQLQFYSFTGGRLVNELTLQGGTLEVCFDF